MPGRLAGAVALVTGGASGIGAATATRFSEEGAAVIVADLLGDRATQVANALPGRAVGVQVDVTSEDQVAAAVDAAVDRFGRLDVMVNNAGILGAVGSVAKLSMTDVDRTIAVTLRGTIVGMKHAARVMIPQRSGVILCTSSPAGIVGGVGPHAYSAAKAAILGLMRSVAAELRPHGIRVNAIVPGAIVTAMTADILTGDPGDLDGAHEALANDVLLGRPGLPHDIAAGALYLASADAAFVTGHALAVDAGYTTIAGPSPFATGDHSEPAMFLGPTRTIR
jgi:NAD(P)-dependent dehydrogenase (short-subunit alcohol dehydrogenase family)